MLSRVILKLYHLIVEIMLWLGILVGAGVGLTLGSVAGRMQGNSDLGLFGMIGGAVGSFLFLALFVGGTLVVEQMQKSIARIEARLDAIGPDRPQNPPSGASIGSSAATGTAPASSATSWSKPTPMAGAGTVSPNSPTDNRSA